METLGSEGGLQLFMDSLSERYVQQFNIVRKYNPLADLSAVRLLVDTEMRKVEKDVTKNCFKLSWNDAVKSNPAAMIDGEMKLGEWRWVFGPMKVACRHAFAAVVQDQLDPRKGGQVDEHTQDAESEIHDYYCVGVVGHYLKAKYSSSVRKSVVIQSMFLSQAEAHAQHLPTHEVDSR